MALSGASEVLRVGPLELRPAEYTATLAGRILALSHRELQLLEAFMRSQGRIVARDELYEAVWGGDQRVQDRSVDAYVHKLRSKLEASGWVFLHTHHRFGYRFSPEPQEVATGASQEDNKADPQA